jgi:hypothetical protein
MNCLTSVDYSDGTHAYYTYEDDNVPDDPQHGSSKIFPLVSTCNDVRYHGPMRRVAYDYQNQGPHGAILKERYSPSDGVKGVMVSSIDPPAPSPIAPDPDFETTYTETRGDSPTRTFTYTTLHLHRSFSEPDPCPTWRPPLDPAPQQFLLSYTDFQNHITSLATTPIGMSIQLRTPIITRPVTLGARLHRMALAKSRRFNTLVTIPLLTTHILIAATT